MSVCKYYSAGVSVATGWCIEPGLVCVGSEVRKLKVMVVVDAVFVFVDQNENVDRAGSGEIS